MGLTTGNFPPVEPATFLREPYLGRIKVLARQWVDYGFGAPNITGLIYVVKLLFFYALGGILVATLTSGLDPLHPAAGWDAPVVYQNLVVPQQPARRRRLAARARAEHALPDAAAVQRRRAHVLRRDGRRDHRRAH